MDAYLENFQFSSLPFPEWAVFLIWFVLFAGANILQLKSRTLFRSQAHIAVAEPKLAQPSIAWLLLAQIAFAVVIFTCAHFIGGFGFVTLAGGWTVTTAVIFAFNLQSALSLAAISKPGASEGVLRLSGRQAARDKAFQMFGGAAFCFCSGMLIAHMSLLAGALFLASSGMGFLRKANALA